MKRKSKNEIREFVEDPTEFYIKVTNKKGKFWIGTIKAKNAEKAISEFSESMGNKAKNYILQII